MRAVEWSSPLGVGETSSCIELPYSDLECEVYYPYRFEMSLCEDKVTEGSQLSVP